MTLVMSEWKVYDTVGLSPLSCDGKTSECPILELKTRRAIILDMTWQSPATSWHFSAVPTFNFIELYSNCFTFFLGKFSIIRQDGVVTREEAIYRPQSVYTVTGKLVTPIILSQELLHTFLLFPGVFTNNILPSPLIVFGISIFITERF